MDNNMNSNPDDNVADRGGAASSHPGNNNDGNNMADVQDMVAEKAGKLINKHGSY